PPGWTRAECDVPHPVSPDDSDASGGRGPHHGDEVAKSLSRLNSPRRRHMKRDRSMKFPKWLYLGMLLLAAAIGCHRRPSRAAQIQKGDELFASKNFLEATKAYYAAALNGPPDAQLFVKVAQTGLRGGPIMVSVDAARRAATLLPDDIDVQLLAA